MFLLVMFSACNTEHKVVHEADTTHTVKANTVHKIEVAPMHITIDINIKVDKALEDFFGDLDE
jgi:hypothetical protein